MRGICKMEKSKAAVDESTNVDYRTEIPDGLVSLPPAYDKPVNTTLKVAKILSLTVIAVTVIVGVIVVLGVYVHHANSCSCDGDLSGAASQPLPIAAARIDRFDEKPENVLDGSGKRSKKIPLPVKLELDATLGDMMKSPKNKKAQVNCVVESKKATQVISEDPKTLMTPFGNFSTDPKVVHLQGERMVFSCFSAVQQAKKSSKTKKPKLTGLLPRPRRSLEENSCACSCDC